MERRVLLAIFLCFLVLYVWQALFVKPAPKPPAGAVPTETSAPAPTGAAAPATAPAPAVAAPSRPEVTPLVADAAERDIRVETDDVIAVFTNRGGRLKSWRLKRYLDRNREPLELVATELAGSQPLPFSLRTADDVITGRLNTALYSIRQSGSRVTFEYRDTAGLRAVKDFALAPGYQVSVRIEATQGDRSLDPQIVWGPGLGDTDAQTGRYAVKPGGLFAASGKVTRLSASNVAKQADYDQTFDYAGVDDHYFMTVVLKPGAAKVSYQPVSLPPPPGTKNPARDFMSYSVSTAAANQPLVFYVGPKDFDTLASIDRNFVKAINFGMFSVIVVPLLRSLNWINQFVGNYGWAIVVLTVLINIVLFPLNHKSVVSMRKMQEIQPEAKAIQDRYAKLKATDPARQKMNQELMALYRERGVNPASGCVPILLTLPVFLAFYAMLQTAIELRGAPFVGWIQDLSAPDPYYVLPVLVGLTQIIQQWLTPATGTDPAQQKMMMIMPVVLIFVFIATPAGALIYWFVGNIWRIGQMQLTNYLIGPPPVRTVRPPAERRLKRVGSGKTQNAAKEK